ncbi:hypothetical protein M405DRAFT_835323 [Rhizopogon salebrosus TDB-379]|nr:hypothetical protein M405DRAFT_835323 [Rhizopogon salebrosus TDB-379]
MSSLTNNEKGKQGEESPADTEIPHDGPASPAKFDTNRTRALWKGLIRARGKGTKKAAMKTHDPPPEVVEHTRVARHKQVHLRMVILHSRMRLPKHR